MRLVFVSGVAVGGSFRSTCQLASALAARGHDVTVVAPRPQTMRAFALWQRGVNLWVKLDAAGRRRAAVATRRVLRRVGRRTGAVPGDRFALLRSSRPENAVAAVVRRSPPDAVVVSSVTRAAWRWMLADLRAAGITSVLYLREAHAASHLTVSGAVPDVLVANSDALAREVRAAGHECAVVPSIVDRSASAVTSTRRAVLYVNPVPEMGLDIAVQLASARPDIPFVFQESWPLDAPARAALVARLARLGNVELRAFVDDPAQVYRDARVVLAPYPTGRPRVVAEAQHNGIPVLATDQPAMVEAVGEGGAVVAAGSPVGRWVEALGRLWDDDGVYQSAVAAARRHDRRAELDPARAAAALEHVVAAGARSRG